MQNELVCAEATVGLSQIGGFRSSQRWSAALAFTFVFLLASACSAGYDACTRGNCAFRHEATACVSEDLYERFTKELVYIHETGDTRKVGRFYRDGLCRRFPAGTLVTVLEPGLFRVKVRFRSLDAPDAWISAEFLRPKP